MTVADILSKENRICSALVDLDERLSKFNVMPFNVQVMQDFALLPEPIVLKDGEKANMDQIKELVSNVGSMYGLGPDWLNSTFVSTGTELENMEWATGKIKFHTKDQLHNIIVSAADWNDVLRLRMCALDSIVANGEINEQCVEDIKALMKHLNIHLDTLKEQMSDIVVNDTIYELL